MDQDVAAKEQPRYIKLNERDNVAIVVNDFGLPAGSRFACGLTLRAFVPQGHKTALVDIAQSWRSQNRCREGAPALRQAIDLLAGTGDPLLVQPFPESYRSTLEAWMARCERESAGR